MRRAWNAAVRRAARVADELVEVDVSPFADAARLLYEGPWIAVRYAAVGAFLERDDVGADPVVRRIVLGGRSPSAAVVGAHLTGMPRNHELTSRGARLVRRTRTAACYRLFDHDDGTGRPGMVRDAREGGAVEVEVWRLGAEGFGTFVAGVAAPLVIGTVELEDGCTVHGFLCEAHAVCDVPEATGYGAWRRYVKAVR